MKTPAPHIAPAATMSLLIALTLTGCASAGNTSFELVTDEQAGILQVLENDTPVLSYRYGEQLPQGVPADRARAGYIHPVYSLQGQALTGDFPEDHYHHRGVYSAWPNVKVGDEWLDLWHLDGIKPVFQRWQRRTIDHGRAVIETVQHWQANGRTVARETTSITIHPARNDSRAIDITSHIEAIGGPLTLRGEFAANKGYGGFNVRFADRQDTQLVTDRGLQTDDSLGTPYRWAGLFARFEATPSEPPTFSETHAGIVIFPDPTNPDAPTDWILRNYGFVGVCWPGTTPRELQAGQSVSLRFRLMVYEGPPAIPTIESDYQRFITP